jgi:hypothetical protein
MPAGGQLARDRIFFSLGSPHSWTEVPEIRNVGALPNRERDKVETTVYSASSERTNIPGLATVSDFEFTTLANQSAGSVHQLIKRQEASQVTYWWRVEVSVSSDLSTTQYTAYTFQGKVSKWELTSSVDGVKEINITVQYSANLMFQEELASVGP